MPQLLSDLRLKQLQLELLVDPVSTVHLIQLRQVLQIRLLLLGLMDLVRFLVGALLLPRRQLVPQLLLALGRWRRLLPQILRLLLPSELLLTKPGTVT